jgi:predicted GNAT superfamily acetyltransferase
MSDLVLRILETPQEMTQVENLQRIIWSGNETEIVPINLLVAAIHNGGLAIGAYPAEPHDPARTVEPSQPMIGFVFGFPGFYPTPDGPRLKHCSHMLGVHPDFRNKGVGFMLKRAQWQMVRQQGIDNITWTYDPLLSRNAQLNITKLGAVCNTYLRNEYGKMQDDLNAGLVSDRLQVDWWVNSQRVNLRLSKKKRPQLDLAHFLAAGAEIINPSRPGSDGWPRPPALQSRPLSMIDSEHPPTLLLLEIPPDFQALRVANLELASEWRYHIRALFEDLFAWGYLITDFIFQTEDLTRSFYVLSFGESTL